MEQSHPIQRPTSDRDTVRREPSGGEQDTVVGRNAVSELLRSGRPIDRILIARGDRDGNLSALAARCRQRGLVIKEVDPRKLEALGGDHHQGTAPVLACGEYATVDDLFAAAEAAGQPPLFVVCDDLEDPHNLGAILRTAEAVGAHGVIVPKRHSAGLTSAVYKASAGAAAFVPVARVTNITETLKALKKRGVWVYGLDMDGQPWCGTDMTGSVALVVGSEGKGISPLVRKQCDFVLSLPMVGRVNSLNASVATAIVLYEAARQRLNIPAKN